jgi:L-lactate dehydrogenase complex protein LldG
MSDRETIFERIRSALGPVHEAGKATPYPEYDPEIAVCRNHPEFASLWELFAHKLEAVNGTPLSGYDELARWLKGEGMTFGYCDPELAPALQATPEFDGIRLETSFERARIDDYEFGITRAAGAIAESGTVVLKDALTSSRLGALAPWVHVAVLPEDRLFAALHEAVADLGDDPSVIWATGPSKTADIEGILIEGVHGPGVQIVCLDDA